MDWVLMPMRRYAEFGGRSRRKEYWMFILFYFLVYVAASIADYLLGYGAASTAAGDGAASFSYSSYGPVEIVVLLVFFIPGLAVLIRRLHDTDRRGWWVLLSLIPLVGSIILLVWLCLDGTQGANRFGPDLKAGEPAGVRPVY